MDLLKLEVLTMVSFSDAVKLGFQGYTDFRGRSIRAEFWWWLLFFYGVHTGAWLIDSFLTGGILGILVFLGLIIPYWVVAVRRLHDTNRSGWWILVGLIPLVGIILLLVFSSNRALHGKQTIIAISRLIPKNPNPNTVPSVAVLLD